MIRHLVATFLLIAVQAAAESRDGAPLLNQFRAEAGLPALAPSPQLEQAARLHAEDMARQGYFSHVGRDGSGVGQRVDRSGYGWCDIAENIAMGHDSIAEVMAGWMNSPSHRKNILSRRVRDFGLARGPKDTWVLVLGRPGCRAPRLRGQ